VACDAKLFIFDKAVSFIVEAAVTDSDLLFASSTCLIADE
jgi:hypothetical protein